MSDIPKLGLLKPVPLREAWPNEATSFTPWLHEEENMTALGEALGFEQLVALGREQAVGPFSADLLAEDTAGNRVVIENQLEQSDHDHLGKCLTYAAGLKAKTIVWLCAKLREEHRAAIDWLNDASTDDYSFFAVEIELYRIGESDFAPRFNVSANPNNWSREVRQQARRVEGELTDAQKSHREYWGKLISHAAGKYSALSNRPAYKGNWQTAETVSVTTQNAKLSVDINVTRLRSNIRCELYLYAGEAKAGFDYFKMQIEKRGLLLEHDITWERLDDKKSSRISIYRREPKAVSASDLAQELEWTVLTLRDLAESAHLLVDELRQDGTPIEPLLDN